MRARDAWAHFRGRRQAGSDDMNARRGRPPNDPLTLYGEGEFRRYLLGEKHAKPGDDDADAPLLVHLARSKFHVGTKQRKTGPTKLTPRHLALIARIVAGVDPYVAARALGYQRRAVRRLYQSPIFLAALQRQRMAK